jgi:hypothetical protein
MRLTKTQIKKLIGYLSSIIVLVFLGEPFLQGTGDVVSTLNKDEQPAKADRFDRY